MRTLFFYWKTAEIEEKESEKGKEEEEEKGKEIASHFMDGKGFT